MVRENEVFVATPMYGGMCAAPYTRGMIDALYALKTNGYDLSYLFVCNESLITRARNFLVDKFLNESKAKYFMFIDADIGFTGEDILKLVKSEKEFVCGLYPKKIIDWERVRNISRQGVDDIENYASSYVVNTVDGNEIPTNTQNGLIEIKHGGTGFMMVQRSVFEKLLPYVKEYRTSTIQNPDGSLLKTVKEFFALDIVGEGKYLLSEDYFFCELWRNHGGKIYANLDIKLSHFGSHEFKGDLYLGGANQGNQ